MARLQGKVAFITGAGRGIGRGIALAFAREGASLGLLEIDAGLLAESAKLIAGQGAKCLAIEGDVATRAICADAIGRTVERETFGAMVPRLDWRGGFSRRDTPPQISTDAGPITIGQKDVLSSDFTLSFPLFAFGRFFYAWRAAQPG